MNDFVAFVLCSPTSPTLTFLPFPHFLPLPSLPSPSLSTFPYLQYLPLPTSFPQPRTTTLDLMPSFAQLVAINKE